MGKTEWKVETDSLWVIAPTEDVVGNEGSRVLADTARVVRQETTEGLGVPAFTQPDYAERYIRDGGELFSGHEPARFESLAAFIFFMRDMELSGVSCFVIDNEYGRSHGWITAFRTVVASLEQALAEPPPETDDP